jgi:hypothetical protein
MYSEIRDALSSDGAVKTLDEDAAVQMLTFGE